MFLYVWNNAMNEVDVEITCYFFSTRYNNNNSNKNNINNNNNIKGHYCFFSKSTC